jgi:hypothetical protein
MPDSNGILELRERVMAVKKEREDCLKRISALGALEQDLRNQLVQTCPHEFIIGIRGDALFDFTAGGSCEVRQLIPPQRLCCGCGHQEIGIFTSEAAAKLRRDLLMASLHPSDLIEQTANFVNLVNAPKKRIYRDVYEEYVRRHDLADPIVRGPVLLLNAPTGPLAVTIEPHGT